MSSNRLELLSTPNWKNNLNKKKQVFFDSYILAHIFLSFSCHYKSFILLVWYIHVCTVRILDKNMGTPQTNHWLKRLGDFTELQNTAFNVLLEKVSSIPMSSKPNKIQSTQIWNHIQTFQRLLSSIRLVFLVHYLVKKQKQKHLPKFSFLMRVTLVLLVADYHEPFVGWLLIVYFENRSIDGIVILFVMWRERNLFLVVQWLRHVVQWRTGKFTNFDVQTTHWQVLSMYWTNGWSRSYARLWLTL